MYFGEEDMVHKLGLGIYYRDSYFSEDVVDKKVDTVKVDELIEKWDDMDQYQLYIEALK